MRRRSDPPDLSFAGLAHLVPLAQLGVTESSRLHATNNPSEPKNAISSATSRTNAEVRGSAKIAVQVGFRLAECRTRRSWARTWQPGLRLIQQQQRRTVKEGARQCQTLNHAARERCYPSIALFGESDLTRSGLHALLGSVEGVESREDPQVLARGQLWMHHRLVADQANRPTRVPWISSQRSTGDPYVAAGRSNQPGNNS